ncbi:uracil-DNA glycosylase [Patescibacteria group bacterium]|nr:uracil-DNA glycosylase [Patescibacteria group bacterium]
MSSTLDHIADEIRAHKGCGFEPCEQATNLVPGEGNPKADIMFIGEAPGKNEDLQGRPFVGAAGKLLDELIASINLKREDVFIGNVVKGRPPGNRDPKPEEIAHSWPWLKDQVAAIQPKIIVLLGRHAMDWFLPDLRISADHGNAKRYRGQVYLPMYHPAAALYNGGLRQTLFDDFAKIPKLLEKVKKLPKEEVVIEPAYEAKEEPVTAQTESTTKPKAKETKKADQATLFNI